MYLGYYNGVIRDVTEESIISGGECEDGLKMVLVIGDAIFDEYTKMSTAPPATGDETSAGSMNIP